jgi:hypothetical protein
LCRDQATLQKRLNSLLHSDIAVHRFKGGYVRFHELTEGTISIANTGAATDTILFKETSSLFTVARSALFNSTIQNLEKQSQVLAGMIFMVDHTTTSPDTDAGSIEFDLLFQHRSGGAPTYDQNGYAVRRFKLESHVVVEAAGIGTLPYAGPFILDFQSPLVIQKNQSSVEYIGCTCILYRTTADRPAFTAHTVVTTYTIKVAGYAIVVDPEVIAAYPSMDAFWNEFMKEG